MNVLWDIQKKRRFISRDDMTKISKEFDISRMELEGVISFYHFYHREHAGKYTIYLNTSIVSKHKNYEEVKKAFEKEIGVSFGQVSEDKMFGLFETACIGLSDQETSALINFNAFTDLTAIKVKNIISRLRKGEKIEDLSKIPKNNIRYTPAKDKIVFFKNNIPGIALRMLKKMDSDKVIDLVKLSKLAGRGGAFFPTGLKWQFCKNNHANQKYVICNADEGEPGTFKDRVLMNRHPGLLLEGMAIAGYAVGATKGFIYLRAEYAYLKDKIEKRIVDFEEKGLLGNNIMGIEGFHFNVSIYMGAGAYVCGEETALIQSMEGKRGEPTIKEFFPVERGYLGKPTLVNNVETLCAVPRILEMGVEKWLKIGTEKTPGTKLISVSGDCDKPGMYEIEWGMKLKDFLSLIGAQDPNFILFNGYSGECLSSDDFEREISGENLLAEQIKFNPDDPIEYSKKISAVGIRSGGSFMTFSKDRNLLNILKNVNNFFVEESCGICVPCRTGNFLLKKKLKKFLLGNAEQKDLDDIKEWSKIIKLASRCGLGQTSSTALLCAMKKFPEVFQAKITENTNYSKSFDLDKAVADYDEIINEIETNYG
ncbi:MAG: NAD(P)H-dependent oxidoreductase subunit E [Flavobacteriaceae bacterium]|nr:NAD(P)H-dependent oxidoreductase subunit E [Flavobacteriaceae bacterium]